MIDTTNMEKIKQLFSVRIVQLCFAMLVVIGLIVTIQYLQSSKSDVRGVFTLSDSSMDFTEGEECFGSGGYGDIAAGTQVKVSDGADKIIAVSSLQSGKMDNSYECVFSFTIPDTPRSDIYQFEVAERGKITYSHKDLVKDDYFIELSLGD